jgi:predicted nucleic acid-binding protein
MLCIDANVIVPYVTAIPHEPVERAWNTWLAAHEEFVVPPLAFYEITNAIRQYQKAHVLTTNAARKALETALALPITMSSDLGDHLRALELAAQLNRPATYDAHYLALAERLGVEFWTADERLYNATRHALPWVRLVS